MAFAKKIGLAAIVAATQSAAGFLHVPKKEAEKLAADGLVEINADPSLVTPEGVPTRATAKGVASLAPAPAAGGFGAPAPAAAAPAAAKSSFVVETGVPVPAAAARGRAAGSMYPFEQMEVGHSFMVKDKEPKALASTVSSANARFAVPVVGQTRQNRNGETVQKMQFTKKFIARAVEGGTRIWRTA